LTAQVGFTLSWLHPECGRSSWPEAEHAIWYVQT